MKYGMKHARNALLRIHDLICDWCAEASAWMMLMMALAISYEIFARYFFDKPTIWAADLTDFMLLYTTLLASAWLLKRDGHVKLTILLDRLSPKSRSVMEAVNSLLGAIICGFVVWYGTANTLDALRRSITIPRPLEVPKYLIVGVIPLGAFLFLVQFLRNGFGYLTQIKGIPQTEK